MMMIVDNSQYWPGFIEPVLEAERERITHSLSIPDDVHGGEFTLERDKHAMREILRYVLHVWTGPLIEEQVVEDVEYKVAIPWRPVEQEFWRGLRYYVWSKAAQVFSPWNSRGWRSKLWWKVANWMESKIGPPEYRYETKKFPVTIQRDVRYMMPFLKGDDEKSITKRFMAWGWQDKYRTAHGLIRAQAWLKQQEQRWQEGVFVLDRRALDELHYILDSATEDE